MYCSYGTLGKRLAHRLESSLCTIYHSSTIPVVRLRTSTCLCHRRSVSGCVSRWNEAPVDTWNTLPCISRRYSSTRSLNEIRWEVYNKGIEECDPNGKELEVTDGLDEEEGVLHEPLNREDGDCGNCTTEPTRIGSPQQINAVTGSAGRDEYGTAEEYNEDTLDEDMFASGYSQAFTQPQASQDQIYPQGHPHLSATQAKVDLSYYHVGRREVMVREDGLAASPRTNQSRFRNNAGMRRILYLYMHSIEPLLSSEGPSSQAEHELNQKLREVFSPQTLQLLYNKGYDVEDIVMWSWIINAVDVQSCIARFTYVAQNRRASKKVALPLFIPLQCLRAEHIQSESLTRLLTEVETDVGLQNRWGPDSGPILLIRLLRHARLTDVRLFERITELTPKVVPIETRKSHHANVQRLTHFYNRFLSLISLPVARHPFLSIDIQQRAQLNIARSMTSSDIHIPLNREGYRALARVQLMHKKTTSEQKWSSIKAPSWPPWRRDELGIDAKTEYPGKESRVAKVIKRFLEAGYGPESVEQEAQILAGWDVDKSPTIQVRRIPRRRPLSWIKQMFRTETAEAAETDHHIWAARVAATRSVREAWVCFYAYMQATMSSSRKLFVYHEMFLKLFARIQHTDQKSAPFPGEGKEIYPDPSSPRDIVYVPQEPPTIKELYAQMLQDGIKPAGRLLTGLMDNARTLQDGLDYINNSTLSEVKRDVLMHSEKYPRYFIRSMFTTLPDYFLASYLGVFTKNSQLDRTELFWPGSKSNEEQYPLPTAKVKPLHYVLAIMDIWKPNYMPAYHTVLEGVCIQARGRRTTDNVNNSRQFSYAELWRMAKHTLDLQREVGIPADLVCFRKLVLLARNDVIRAPARFIDNNNLATETSDILKSVFAQAMNGKVEANVLHLRGGELAIGQQPYWKDVEALILVLGFGRNNDAVLEVLRWLKEEQDNLICVEQGTYKMQRLMCAVCTALEMKWVRKSSKGVNAQQVQEARSMAEQWGWPDEVDVEEYLKHHRVWFDGMRAAMDDS